MWGGDAKCSFKPHNQHQHPAQPSQAVSGEYRPGWEETETRGQVFCKYVSLSSKFTNTLSVYVYFFLWWRSGRLQNLMLQSDLSSHVSKICLKHVSQSGMDSLKKTAQNRPSRQGAGLPRLDVSKFRTNVQSPTFCECLFSKLSE